MGRLAFAVGGMVYGALGAATLSRLYLGGSSGSGGESEQAMVGKLLSIPGGTWIVGLVGLIILGYGMVQVRSAFKQSYLEKFDSRRMSRNELTAASRLGAVGLTARGIVLGIVGWFILLAAFRHDSDEAGGLKQALAWLGSQPYGPWLLALVASGLFLFGLYVLMLARYRRFQRRS